MSLSEDTRWALSGTYMPLHLFILGRWDVVERGLVVREQLHALVLHSSPSPHTLNIQVLGPVSRRCGLVIIDCPASFWDTVDPSAEGWLEQTTTIF
jgi:hypothetical protein